MSLSYYVHGTGPVRVICAHSWVVSNVTYAPMLSHLNPDQATWVFPDFRGYGSSGELDGDVSVDAMGQDLVQVANDLGWDQFHLVGHSMGGKAVQAALRNLENHERILSATLVNAVTSTPFPLDSESEAFFLEAAGTPSLMASAIENLAGGCQGEGFIKYVSALWSATSNAEAMRAYLPAWTNQDVSEGLAAYTAPVLVVSGEFDPILGPSVSAGTAAQFPQGTHEVIQGTGHFAPFEASAHLADLIARHLDSVSDSRKELSNS